jgi:hypothetical protein
MMATLSPERVDQSRVTRLTVLHSKWRRRLLREVLRLWWLDLDLPPPLVSSSDDEPIPLPHDLSESESDSDSNSDTAMEVMRSLVLLHITQQSDRQANR